MKNKVIRYYIFKDGTRKNKMIIDLILDRKDGNGYNAHDFYFDCMAYGKIADGITRAMDGGTEADVKEELKRYIIQNEYNTEICDYIESVMWLNEENPERTYQAIRIKKNGVATYGDMYKRIISFRELKRKETVEIGTDEYLILFEEEK